MIFDFSKLTLGEKYHMMIGAIAPRPIAWVSTLSPDGKVNLAPFSYFTAVCAEPPTLCFSIARKLDGTKKDTLINIEATREMVVQIASTSLALQVDNTSEDLPYGVSEMSEEKLTSLPSLKVKPPRVAECMIHFECKLHQLVEVGTGGRGASTLVLAEILQAHIDDSLLGERNAILFDKLSPLTRLGGKYYGKGTEAFTV